MFMSLLIKKYRLISRYSCVTVIKIFIIVPSLKYIAKRSYRVSVEAYTALQCASNALWQKENRDKQYSYDYKIIKHKHHHWEGNGEYTNKITLLKSENTAAKSFLYRHFLKYR